jgi:cell division protein FtsW
MKKIDKILLLTTIISGILGIIMIYSASNIWAEYKFNNPYKYVIHQSIFFIIGIFLMLILSKVNYKIYYKYANKILFICFILLILVLIPGIGKIRNGARSWFGIGSFGIQPSEFAKIGLIIFVSKYLANNDKDVKYVVKGLFPILFIIFLFFGLIMLEPDFGQGMVIVLTLIMIIFISGAKISFFVKCGILGLIGIVILIIIAPYRMARIVSFLNPWVDPLGSGFQIIQSLYAIGPGGLLGLGFGNSIQKHFYLPEPQTDFIFSIISEEFGFLGVLVVSSLFIIIFVRSIKISLSCKDLFSKYLSFGLSFGILIQALLNLCVVVGLIPVTGVTLPFFSYGGSSLLVSMASIGIILSISKNNNS